MIYLIGGPPRCGKTTLARALSKRLHIPYVPADYLMSVISPYIPHEEMAERLPRWHARVQTDKSNDRMYAEYSPEQILGFYNKEAETYWPGIKNFILYALHDDQDFIIEGGQLRPDLVHSFVESEGVERFRTVFLYKSGDSIADELKEGNDPNDWAKRDTSEETYHRIAEMIRVFSAQVVAECDTHGLRAYDTSGDFQMHIERLTEELASN
ncbi:MAG: hypothetical protein WCO52_03450 [bacterium]